MSNSGFHPNLPYNAGALTGVEAEEVAPLGLFADHESGGPLNAPGVIGSDPAKSNDSLLPSTVAEFLTVFENLSGWKAEFQESRESWRRRTTTSTPAATLPHGSFEIVDMSEKWPAEKHTAHRGQCDQLMQLFGAMFEQWQACQAELVKSQSALESIAPGTMQDDELLVDAFAPLFTNGVCQNDVSSDEEFSVVRLGDESEFNLGLDEDDFNVCQRIEDGFGLDPVVWEGWSVAGTVGLNGDAYLDWQQQQHLVTIGAGVIESDLGDGDASAWLEVCAATQRFRLCDDCGLNSFYVWDRRGGVLAPVQVGDWQKLPAGNALIASTTELTADALLIAAEQRDGVSADELIKAVLGHVDSGQRALVLKRD